MNDVWATHLTYAHTFQKFKNPAIRNCVAERLKAGTLLWKNPYVELSRPFEFGDTFADLTRDGLLHPDTAKCFTAGAGDRAAAPLHGRFAPLASV